MSKVFYVRPFKGPVNIDVRVPGSKSMTNRALLLAALADGESVLRGVGMSDDSRVFMEALTALGFDLTESYGTDGSVTVRVTGHGGNLPQKKAHVHVGSAGTAARFLTAMTALSDGTYELTSSDQMKARPMRELLEALELLGATFTFHETPYAFPFTVCGRCYAATGSAAADAMSKDSGEGSVADASTADQTAKTIPLNIDRSSQFLSALLLCAPMIPEGCSIQLTGTRSARSYVEITERMMAQFGYTPDKQDDLTAEIREPEQKDHASMDSSASSQLIDERNIYRVFPHTAYQAQDYTIEPDVSAACYFYAMAAVNGGAAHVYGVTRDNSQGDMRFLDVLSQMGCEVGEIVSDREDNGEIIVVRATEQSLHGIEIDMSDFSDQTMTLAAIAPFADAPTTITGVAHIRGQESDRIRAIATELNRLGVHCEEREDGVRILPLGDSIEDEESSRDEVLVRTYNDHRIAMAFAVTGTRLPGVTIDNPDCCRKTFDNYFEMLFSLAGQDGVC